MKGWLSFKRYDMLMFLKDKKGKTKIILFYMKNSIFEWISFFDCKGENHWTLA